jgi:hypothetical protein
MTTGHKKYTLCLSGLIRECESLEHAQHVYTTEIVPQLGGRFNCPDASILTSRTSYTIEALFGRVKNRAGRVVMR